MVSIPGIADVMARLTSLKAKQAEEADRIRLGAAYVASPNRYLLLNLGRTLSLCQSGPVDFLRPSDDLRFESVPAFFKD